MKFILVLCALVVAVAASYGSNTYDGAAPLPYPGHNRVYDEFYHPSRRSHRRRHHRDFSDSSSDSDSNSRESRERGYVYLPPIAVNYGGNVAQDSSSYGSMSNDAPAQSAYGSPAQDSPATGY